MADWPVRAADAIDGVVAGVHDRVIRPVILGARAVVFGLLILAASIVLAVLVSVALVRLLDRLRVRRPGVGVLPAPR